MDPVYEGTVHVFQGRFFAKWKRFKGAVFDENKTGRARLELYTSESQLAALTPSKSILLAEALAIRIVCFRNTITKDNRIIQIQQRNAPVLLIAVEDIEEWHYVLCKIAFPDQFASIGIQPCSSLSNDSNDEYDIPWDLSQIPVLLQNSTNAHRVSIPDGNYEISFGESIFLKNCSHCVESWPYSQIRWFGTGDSCFAFEVGSDQRFEFKCRRPQNVLDALRSHLKLKTDVALPTNTRNVYTAQYVPCSQKIDRSSERLERSLMPTPSFRNGLSPSNQPPSETRSRFAFFHKKKENQKREKFEMNADDEWIRYSRENLGELYEGDIYDKKLPGICYQILPDVSGELPFKNELERTIAKRALCQSFSSETVPNLGKKAILRPRVIQDGELSDTISSSVNNVENDSGMGSLHARLRDSVASAPSPSPVPCKPAPINGHFRQSFIN